MPVLTAIGCIMNSQSFWFFLSVVSTLEFWISHRSAWFVALLLPLYFLSPLIFKLLKQNGFVKFVLISILCYVIALYPNGETEWTFFKNIQFVMIRIPVFILGMYFAPKIKNEGEISLMSLFLLLIGAIGMLCVTKKPVNSYLFLTVPLILALSSTISRTSQYFWNKMCSFFGEISLESYLFNSIGRFILPLMTLFHIPDYNNLLMYSMVVILGTLLAFGVHKLSQPIITKTTDLLTK